MLHPERCAEETRRWRAANRERYNARERRRDRSAYLTQYHREHPAYRRIAGAFRRARRRETTVERIDPHVIFARDGWRCHVCDLDVDPSLRYPHPLSASLDHVQALAAGGEHVVGNVATAHLHCNQSKGRYSPNRRGEPPPFAGLL